MSKAVDKIYSSVKTLKSFRTNLSFDSDEDDDRKKTMSKKDNTNDLFSIDEYNQKENCTYYNLGTIPMSQKCYTCSICDQTNQSEEKYICQFCYLNCHKPCRDSRDKKKHERLGFVNDKMPTENKDFKGIKEFYCLCGHEYKHKPTTPIFKEFSHCDLLKLDKALNLENFRCVTHNIQICCVCSVQCHNKCRIEKKKD